MKSRISKKYISIMLILVMVIIIFTMPIMAKLKDEKPILDSEKAVVFDIRTGSSLFGKEENKEISPSWIKKYIVLALLVDENKFSSINIERLIYENDDEVFEKAINLLGENDAAVTQKAMELSKKIGNEQTVIGSLIENGTLEKTTLKEATNFLTFAFKNDEVIKHLKFQKINENKKDKDSEKIVKTKIFVKDKDGISYIGAGKKDESIFFAITVDGADIDTTEKDGNELIDFYLNSYRSYKVVSKNEKVSEIKVKGGRKSYVDVIAEKDLYVILPKEAEDSIIKTKIDMKQELIAPVKEKTKIGDLKVIEVGEVTSSIPLLTKENIVVGGPWSKIGISDYMMLTGTIIFVVLLVLIIAIKYRRYKRQKRIRAIKEAQRIRQEQRLQREREEKRRRNWPY